MRVTILQANLTGSWTARRFYNIQGFGLSNALARKGCEVTMLTSNRVLRKEDPGVPWHYRHVEDNGAFRLIYMPTLGMLMKGPVLPTLPLEISRSRPDVVQTDEDAYLHTVLAVGYCSTVGIPVVPWQGIYGFVRRKTKLHKLYCRTLGRIVYRGSTRMMAKTASAKRFLMEVGGVPEGRVDVVPVGTTCSHYAPEDGTELVRSLGLPEGRMLLSVARFAPEKEQSSLIRAMKLISARVPDCYLVLIGNGPCEGELRELSRSLGLQEKVFVVTEPILNKEIRRLYSSAFLYMIPSSFEIFNMTMLESLTCGTPIIARREGGMADVVKHGEVGFLYDDDGESEICEAVCSMVEDPERYRRMRAAAAEYAQEYDWFKVADKFLASYELAIESNRKRKR